MCEIIDNGRTRILNNGTDVTIMANSSSTASALEASKILGVKGVSTAVIEVLTIDSIEETEDLKFGNNTNIYVFLDEEIRNTFVDLLDESSEKICLIEEWNVKTIVKEIMNEIKNKRESNRGFTSNYIHYVR